MVLGYQLTNTSFSLRLMIFLLFPSVESNTVSAPKGTFDMLASSFQWITTFHIIFAFITSLQEVVSVFHFRFSTDRIIKLWRRVLCWSFLLSEVFIAWFNNPLTWKLDWTDLLRSNALKVDVMAILTELSLYCITLNSQKLNPLGFVMDIIKLHAARQVNLFQCSVFLAGLLDI